MIQKKTAEEKIQSVLEEIKGQYDLSPKGEYSTHAHSGYSYRHPAGEIRIDTNKLMLAGGIDFFELEKILAKLQEDGLLEKFDVVSEYA
jgi:hypothetical protein